MTFTPTQKKMVRRIANISSDLTRYVFGLHQLFDERRAALQQARRDLATMRRRHEYMRGPLPPERGMSNELLNEQLDQAPKREQELLDHIAELEAEERRVEELRARANSDSHAAEKLAQRVIELTGLRHEDFPLEGVMRYGGASKEYRSAFAVDLGQLGRGDGGRTWPSPPPMGSPSLSAPEARAAEEALRDVFGAELRDKLTIVYDNSKEK